jgi:MYXO-CTERM domain-containing protein
MISAATALTLAAGIASAGVSTPTFEWVQVDNTVGNPGGDAINGALWNSNNWVTYDLFLTVSGATVNGVNLGSAEGEENLGLSFDTAVFNTQGFVASDFESNAQGTFSASLYDTYVDLGTNNPGGNAASQMLGVALNGLVPQSGVLRGAWSSNPPNGGTAQDASGGIRILRISFDGDALGRGGIGSGDVQIGLATGVITARVGAIPTPGAAALLGLGGIAALRRRR